jgi:hypothetical protein
MIFLTALHATGNSHLDIMRVVQYISVILFALIAATKLAAADGRQIAELVHRIEIAIPEEYRNPDGIVDWGRWRNMPEVTELQQALQTGWPEALLNIQQVAPTNTSQTILFVSARGLDRESYIRFASSAVNLFRNGAITDNRILKWTLMPPDKHLRGFIGDEYKRPDVRRLLQEAQIVFQNDKSLAEMVPFINGILSGEVQKRYAEFEKRSESTPDPRKTVPVDPDETRRQTEPLTSPAAVPNSPAVEGRGSAVTQRVQAYRWVAGALTLALVALFFLKRHASR